MPALTLGANGVELALAVIKGLPDLIETAEGFIGAGNGEAKKQFVLTGIEQIIGISLSAVGANNPKFLAAINSVIDRFAAVLVPHTATPAAG